MQSTLKRGASGNMKDEAPEYGQKRRSGEDRPLLYNCRELARRLFEEAEASRWGLTVDRFVAALERSACKHFPVAAPSSEKLAAYVAGLHVKDLALACACAEGHAAAWEAFVAEYRGILRASAAAMLRCSSGDPEARELADSLFAELYGLAERKRGERSLFHYFHGRSTLKTWLRAVLAQRHVDAARASKRFEPFAEGSDGEPKAVHQSADGTQTLPDPDRAQYVRIFQQAQETALQKLSSRDRERLRLYYAKELTLAEIGRELGEHESSVSRNLERIRNELRREVEEILRRGDHPTDSSTGRKGFSDEQIALCFEYAATDAPIDLDTLFEGAKQTRLPQQRRES